MKIVYQTTSVSVGQMDFTAEAQKIKDSGADAVVTGMDFLQNVALSAALVQDSYKVKVTLYPGGYDSRVTNLPGIDGVYFGIEVAPFEENPPAYLTYKAQMAKEGKYYQGEVPYIGWLTADTFIEGLKAAGLSCPTRQGSSRTCGSEEELDGARRARADRLPRTSSVGPSTACTTCRCRTGCSCPSSVASRSAPPG